MSSILGRITRQHAAVVALALSSAAIHHTKKNQTQQPQAPINHASESVTTFLNQIRHNNGQNRFAPPGLIWQTSSPQLLELAQIPVFQQALTSYGFSTDNNSSTPTRSNVVIRRHTPSDPPLAQQQTPNVSAGGVPALWEAWIQSKIYTELRDQNIIPNDTPPPIYVMPPNFELSAAHGSSLQYHGWHGMPMYVHLSPDLNALNKFSTANMLRNTFIRNIGQYFAIKHNPNSTKFSVGEIYPPALSNPEVLQVGFGYMYNEFKFTIQNAFNLPTYLDKTLATAILSGAVMDKIGRELGQEILLRSGTISIADSESGTREYEQLSAKLLRDHNIQAIRITREAALEKGGTKPNLSPGGSLWEIPTDGNMHPDFIRILLKGFIANGGEVVQGTIKEILTDKNNQVVGTTAQLSPQGRTLISTNKIYTSFGAWTNYTTQEGEHITPPVIPGTGYSSMLVITGKTPITRNYDRNNTHFTPMRDNAGNILYIQKGNEYHTLVKSTCGGALAAPSFCIDHAQNSLFIATQTFPEHSIHILAARSCHRPISYENSVEIDAPQQAQGLLIARGWSGKGITDAAGVAAMIAPQLAAQPSNAKAQACITEETNRLISPN